MFDKASNEDVRSPARPAWVEQTFAWLERRRRAVLVAAVGLQILVLAGMITSRAEPLVSGETVLLRVVPVDPRDLFRGDYVILGYDFSQIPPGEIDGLEQYRTRHLDNHWKGRTVYVSLVREPDGVHWRADKVSVHRPTSGKFLRGRIARWNRLEFGIESYYVQEGMGLEYEEAILDKKLSAEIAITADGEAAIRRLRIEQIEESER